ncbi:response regulator [Devosia indica]
MAEGKDVELSPTVLVVEDEVLVRMVAADILLEGGFKVFEAHDADEAIQLLRTRDDIHAVFTDIEMPGSMNGLELAAIVRKTWPKMVVLVTSGRINPDGELPAGSEFMSKPYSPVELLERLKA